MTATIEKNRVEQTAGGVGRIARVIGPVVDIEFPSDAMPEIYNKLSVEFELGGETVTLPPTSPISKASNRVSEKT